jgi:hypothetical protein
LWRRVWKLNVPERVRHFVRSLLHGRILTNNYRNKMGLGSAMCDYCGTIVETELHVTRDCPLVMPFDGRR